MKTSRDGGAREMCQVEKGWGKRGVVWVDFYEVFEWGGFAHHLLHTCKPLYL